MSKDIKRIYIYNFGGWWSFSLPEWKAFAEQAIKDGGAYMLPHERLIKHKPSCIRIERGGMIEEAYSIDPDIEVFMPVDWDQAEWEYHLRQLSEE